MQKSLQKYRKSAEIYAERTGIYRYIPEINAERTYLHYSSDLIAERNAEMYNEVSYRSNIDCSSTGRNSEITNIIRSCAERKTERTNISLKSLNCRKKFRKNEYQLFGCRKNEEVSIIIILC